MSERQNNPSALLARERVVPEGPNAEASARPRVMHILPRLSPRGGMERLVFEALMHFDRSLFDHVVCCVRDKSGNAQRLEDAGIPVHLVSKRNRLDLSFLWRLSRRLKLEKIDVLHSYSGVYRDGCLAALMAQVPVIVHTDHGMFNNNPQWTRWNHRFFSRFRDRVVGVSNGVGEFLIREVGIAPHKVMTIYDGIDLSLYGRPFDQGSKRRDLDLPEDCLIVGTVGRMFPVKDYRNFLLAAKTVLEKIETVRFIIVGSGPLEKELKNLADELKVSDYVSFLGHREDVPELMQLFDVVVVSSLFESFSLVLAEAMACGKAVVATRVGGIPEVVEDGVTGLLVPPKEHELLARAVVELLMDEHRRQAMGQAGKARVKKHFSIEAMVRSYEDLYTSLLRQKGLVARG